MRCFFISVIYLFLILEAGALDVVDDPEPVTQAVVCETVRAYVATYGEAAAFRWAKDHGWTKERIAEARKCLKNESS